MHACTWLHLCADEAYETFLQRHPLPGGAAAPPPASPEQQQQDKHPAASTRFAWQDAPAVAARCLSSHLQLRWSIQQGVLAGAAESESSGGGGGRAMIKLQLPRVVAGLFRELEEALQPWDSPLPRPADAEHQAVLGVLRSLAQHAQQGGWGGAASSGAASTALDGTGSCPFQIGSQLLVLLSADSAALGILEEGRLVQHKVLTGYTVRRKQGKAQLTYERQGGGEHGGEGQGREGGGRDRPATVGADGPLHCFFLGRCMHAC